MYEVHYVYGETTVHETLADAVEVAGLNALLSPMYVTRPLGNGMAEHVLSFR